MLLSIVGIINGLKSRKVDYVQVFPQATLDKDEHVYMHLPAGYDVDGDRNKYVLKLKKNLYGLKQASFNWSEMLKSGLIEMGFIPSKLDPCVYYKKDIICAVCVDDTVFWSPDESKINKAISELKAHKFELTDEEEVDSFLDIKIDKDEKGNITMTQKGLIETIIKLVGLENDSKQHQTSATTPPLQKHGDSEKFDET